MQVQLWPNLTILSVDKLREIVQIPSVSPMPRGRSTPCRGRHGTKPHGDFADGQRNIACVVCGRSLSAPPPKFPAAWVIHVECNLRAKLSGSSCRYLLEPEQGEHPPFWLNQGWQVTGSYAGVLNEWGYVDLSLVPTDVDTVARSPTARQ